MSKTITARTIFEQHEKTLQLGWIAGQAGATRIINSTQTDQPSTLVGHLNLIRPYLIQVLDSHELTYLQGLGKNSRRDALDTLFSQPALMILLCDDNPAPAQMIEHAEASRTPLLGSPLPAGEIIERLHYDLTDQLSTKQTLHGVFMEVMGLGVLLSGPSGVGKSELALELLSRGHRLIADDAPEFHRSSPDSIHGHCPPLLADFIEVRGLGVLNVRAMYGNHAILASKRLHLIIQIQPASHNAPPVDRLNTKPRYQRILDVDIPEVILPVAPGRDLTVIIEAAVRNHVLYLSGYNAIEDFIERQEQELNRQES